MKLQEILSRYPLARAVFQAVAERERPRRQMDLTRLRHRIMVIADDPAGKKATKEAIREVFDALKQAGFGKIEPSDSPTGWLSFHWKPVDFVDQIRQVLGTPARHPAPAAQGPAAPSTHMPVALSDGQVCYFPAAIPTEDVDYLIAFIKRQALLSQRRGA